MFQDRGINRRQLLQAGVAGAGALGLASLVAGCGDGGGSSAAAGSGVRTGSFLPNYTPVKVDIKPDEPGASDGLVPFFKSYPKDPQPVLKGGPPGDGSQVSALTVTYSPIVAAESRNQYWQQVNKRLNVKLKMQQVPSADYATKVPTVLAGNDLPDFLQFQTLQPSFPDLLKAKFQDLTPFLAGDKINKYPMLANIPQDFWTTEVVYNGGLYGIPIPAYKLINNMFSRDDIIKGLGGLDPNIKSWDDFVALCKGVNDPHKNRWALDHVVEQSTAPAATFGYALHAWVSATSSNRRTGSSPATIPTRKPRVPSAPARAWSNRVSSIPTPSADRQRLTTPLWRTARQ